MGGPCVRAGRGDPRRVRGVQRPPWSSQDLLRSIWAVVLPPRRAQRSLRVIEGWHRRGFAGLTHTFSGGMAWSPVGGSPRIGAGWYSLPAPRTFSEVPVLTEGVWRVTTTDFSAFWTK